VYAVSARRQQCERGIKNWSRLIIAALVATAFAGCAAQPKPAPLGSASCTVDQLGQSAIPVSVAGRDSMISVAQALASAAAGTYPDAQPFAYKIRFHKPLMPYAEGAPPFVMTGQFERACDRNNYLALGWGYSRRQDDHAYAAIAPLDPPQDCPGKQTIVPSIEAIYSPSVTEPETDHSPIRGWQVDLPQITEILRKNHVSFANGLETIEVASARRLRLDDARPSSGCVRTFYGRGGHRRLDAIDGSRTVMELAEAGRPSRRASLAGYCTAGHYLILDAITAEVVERGKYRRCEYFASEQI